MNEKPQSLKEMAYLSLRKRILADGFHAGEFIDDACEAEKLGTSRTPVREALLLLEAEGLVETLARRGIRVVPITRSDMKDVLQILTALEVTAVELISKMTPDKKMLQPIIDACDAMETALESRNADQWLEADENFHCGLMKICGNQHLTETGIRFRHKIRRGHFIASRILPHQKRVKSTKSHQRLIMLLLSDNPPKAIDAHRKQRQSGEMHIMETLDRAKLESM
ncbi:MAG: GntR family transcriptional regulator [Roseovarius sp.]|nr:GntR family transcriptional regulator [Roseovarius sp.]MCY4208258.1 GntR family transcriptional regulator [Roseovarius sp.]MCY4292377.1 GntR family transcriptional regulator [Roseovarius sp.]MCY4314524.1 GntR family transcriptional regulator [Roseovarius sp.]